MYEITKNYTHKKQLKLQLNLNAKSTIMKIEELINNF